MAAFAAVLFLEVAWACVTPVLRGPDEVSHVYRASSVSLGQWRPDYAAAERGELVATKVEPDIVKASSRVCHGLYAEHREGICDPIRTFEDGTVGVTSGADRYNPVYYALVGLPARPFEGTSAIWVMRAVSALLCALLLGFGAHLLISRASTPWPGVAFAAVATPAVFFAGSVVAPNGVTFAAAMLLWAGLVTATRALSGSRAPALASAVGGMLLVSTHATGPLWLATIVMSHVAFAGWRRYASVIASDRRVWAATIAMTAAVTIGCIVWTLTAATNNPSTGGEALVDEVKEIPLAAHVVLWFFQTVGVMPYRFGILWLIIYALWLTALGAVLVFAWMRGTTRSRLGSAVALGASIAIPTAATVMTYDDLGVAWQGRYGLPLLFGVVILAAEGAEQARVRAPRLVPLLAAACFGATHFLALLCLGLRERVDGYDDGRPWLLLLPLAGLLVAASYALLVAVMPRANVRPASADRPD